MGWGTGGSLGDATGIFPQTQQDVTSGTQQAQQQYTISLPQHSHQGLGSLYMVNGTTVNTHIGPTDFYVDDKGNYHMGLEDIYKAVAKRYFDKQMKEVIDE